MTNLSGKVAVITGAASGIGEGTARRFAADGATVVVADVDEAAGTRVAAEIGGTFVRCDVTVEADIEAAVAAAVDGHGHLDVYFGNAGISGVDGPITELDADGFDRTIAVNLRGIALGMKHACRAMRAQATGGSVISTSSVAAMQGGFGPHIYTATKAGILGLTRSVALEQARFGIRVNAICPGGTLTNIFANTAGLRGEAAEQLTAAMATILEQAQPIKRTGLPADIAAAAAYLASDDAAFVTAQAIVVDGGLIGTYGGAGGQDDTQTDAADKALVSY
jgi:NAD(P)-dependent dehydrogenase (short-subunit alcohol dehydrogenase family)